MCGNASCRFQYRDDRTPFIDEIIPRTVTGNEKLYIYGAHRITDLGDERSAGAGEIRYFLIGDKSCSTLDVSQSVEGEDFNRNYRSPISCNSFLRQTAGEYEFTELLKPGLARQSIRTKQTSFLTGANYTQRIAPQITAMS